MIFSHHEAHACNFPLLKKALHPGVPPLYTIGTAHDLTVIIKRTLTSKSENVLTLCTPGVLKMNIYATVW